MVIGDAKHIQQEMGQASRQGVRCGGTELNQDVLGIQEVFSVLYPENCWLYVCCISITCSVLPPLTCSFRVCSVCIQGSSLGATLVQFLRIWWPVSGPKSTYPSRSSIVHENLCPGDFPRHCCHDRHPWTPDVFSYMSFRAFGNST